MKEVCQIMQEDVNLVNMHAENIIGKLPEDVTHYVAGRVYRTQWCLKNVSKRYIWWY